MKDVTFRMRLYSSPEVWVDKDLVWGLLLLAQLWATVNASPSSWSTRWTHKAIYSKTRSNKPLLLLLKRMNIEVTSELWSWSSTSTTS
jgi:hypothetical protein